MLRNEERRTREVVLDLSENGRRTFFTNLSSDNYNSLMLSVLMPFDLLYTYFFRYFRLANLDMVRVYDLDAPVDNGITTEFTMHHHYVGGLVTLSFIFIASVSAHWEVGRQVKIKNNTSMKYITDRLRSVFAQQRNQVVENDIHNADGVTRYQVPDADDYIKSFLEENAPPDIRHHIENRYPLIRVEPQNNRIVVEAYEYQLGRAHLHDDQHHLVRDIGMNEPDMRPEDDHDAADAPNNALNGQPAAQQEPSWLRKLGRQVINKLIYPAWQSVVLSAFIYWILWIGASIFTGILNPMMVEGLPDIIGLGVPLLLGLVVYPAIKIANFFINAPSNDQTKATLEQHKEVEKDFTILIRKALVRQEFKLEEAALNDRLRRLQGPRHQHGNGDAPQNDHVNGKGKTPANGDDPDPENPNDDNAPLGRMDQEIASLKSPHNWWMKPFIKWFSVASGSYVAAQYGTWVLAAIANWLIAPAVSTALLSFAGIPLLAGAFLYGMYRAHEEYQNVKIQEAKINNMTNRAQFNNLERQLDAENVQYAAYKSQFANQNRPGSLTDWITQKPVQHTESQFFLDPSRHGRSAATSWNKFSARLFQLINGGCTGIFLARVFFIAGQAPAPAVTAMAFGYPLTIAILGAVGAAYGVFKVYEYHQQSKDAHALNMLETRTERLEYLNYEVKLSRLRNEVCREELQVRNVPFHLQDQAARVAPQNASMFSRLFSSCFGLVDDAAPDEQAARAPLLRGGGQASY